jgi:hypothetical protein
MQQLTEQYRHDPISMARLRRCPDNKLCSPAARAGVRDHNLPLSPKGRHQGQALPSQARQVGRQGQPNGANRRSLLGPPRPLSLTAAQSTVVLVSDEIRLACRKALIAVMDLSDASSDRLLFK